MVWLSMLATHLQAMGYHFCANVVTLLTFSNTFSHPLINCGVHISLHEVSPFLCSVNRNFFGMACPLKSKASDQKFPPKLKYTDSLLLENQN